MDMTLLMLQVRHMENAYNDCTYEELGSPHVLIIRSLVRWLLSSLLFSLFIHHIERRAKRIRISCGA